MESSSFLGASMASLRPASSFAPTHGRPREVEAEKKYSGLLVAHECGTPLSPFERAGAVAREQSVCLDKTANSFMLDSPQNPCSSAIRASPTTATSMDVMLRQQQSMMELAGFSLTPERRQSGMFIEESEAPAREGKRGQTRAPLPCLPSIPHRSHLKAHARMLSPVGSSTPEGRRHENKTQQFFRLAHERKTQRIRLREQQQRQQQPEEGCCGVAEPHTHARGDAFNAEYETPDACVAPVPETDSVRRRNGSGADAMAAFNSPPTQLPAHTSRGSFVISSVTSLHRETPLPKSMMAVSLHGKQQPSPLSLPKTDECDLSTPPQWEPLPAVPTMRGWGGEEFGGPYPFRELFKAAHTSVRGSWESSSYCGAECIPGEQREWMGVCPARDFKYARSPNWTNLDAMDGDASASQTPEHYASEEATEGEQSLLFLDVDDTCVSAHVLPPLAATASLQVVRDALCSHHAERKATPPAPPLGRPSVLATASTSHVPREVVGKGLFTCSPCLTASASFASSSCSSSARSSGSATSSSRSLSTPKRLPDVTAARPLSGPRRTSPQRVCSGHKVIRDDASSDGEPSNGIQRHADRFATATLVTLPRKAVKQRFFDRFSALKEMLRRKSLP
ncbi:hypothetical protein LSCM1_01405 [Leishmania martiniquensis]|uniref:Uncharacterized protein n=1 Tax=Leishmania martiniquensis TaxID=1580590 RepID=A0A836H5I9_9TRYP|nr:hypothetical protein LSCM1_01405 [Leishmania martiniquensis]